MYEKFPEFLKLATKNNVTIDERTRLLNGEILRVTTQEAQGHRETQ